MEHFLHVLRGVPVDLLVQNAFCVSVVPLTSSQCRLKKKLGAPKNRFCFCWGFAFSWNLYEVVQASLVFGKISSDEICPDISMFPVWMRCLTKTCALTRSVSWLYLFTLLLWLMHRCIKMISFLGAFGNLTVTKSCVQKHVKNPTCCT